MDENVARTVYTAKDGDLFLFFLVTFNHTCILFYAFFNTQACRFNENINKC